MFHRHSTLLGMGAAVVLTFAVGELSHWSPAAIVIAGILGILVLPRVFYGFAASRALDKEQVAAPAGIAPRGHLWDPTPSEEERLEVAIEASKGFGPDVIGPDSSALERLAEGEAMRSPQRGA